ncbi:MAG: biopolymer transporter ExbD [Gammaproteobacteria bacterium]|nr:biopolymer transporter ExbD [Gammaproteobacteria bacterium]MDH5734930.1 biopolymer transporter ExbD [Gammaproteobacteria bacterium]
MKTSRRMKRMARRSRKAPAMNLTSLMDVFTILVFFLLSSSSSGVVIEVPKKIVLPSSVVETEPRETIVLKVTEDMILVQGEPVVSMDEILSNKSPIIPEIGARLSELRKSVIGVSTKKAYESKEVTILAHETIPFNVLKKVMGTCSGMGFENISLAVIQKASQSQ